VPKVEVDAVHIFPSGDVINPFVLPPVTINTVPFHDTLLLEDKSEFAELDANQVIPSDEYINLFVALPLLTVATHTAPLHAILEGL
jgi:kynurenine formamidase